MIFKKLKLFLKDNSYSKSKEKRISVFCGSAFGNLPIFKETAEELGKYCAHNNITVVCGGGRFGMMAALIRSTLDNGGNVIAISARDVWKVEANPDFVTPQTGELYDYLIPKYKKQLSFIMADNLLKRQKLLVESADVYCVLPGSRGTLFEFLQTIVEKSMTNSNKKIILIDPKNMGFWNPLLEQFKTAFKYGFAKDDSSKLFYIFDEIKKISTIEKK